MNYIDLLLILPIVYGAWKGFSRGMIIEMATLGGLLLGIYVSIHFSDYTEDFLRDFFDVTSRYISYVALGVTFLLIVVVVGLLGRVLTGFVNLMSLGLFNKLLGTAFGAFRFFVIVSVLLLVVNALDDKFHFISEESGQKSLLFFPFLNFAQKIYNAIRF